MCLREHRLDLVGLGSIPLKDQPEKADRLPHIDPNNRSWWPAISRAICRLSEWPLSKVQKIVLESNAALCWMKV